MLSRKWRYDAQPIKDYPFLAFFLVCGFGLFDVSNHTEESHTIGRWKEQSLRAAPDDRCAPALLHGPVQGRAMKSQGIGATRSGVPLVMGAAATAGFYLLVTQPFFESSIVQRYTTGHPVEYVTVALFFWAIADLALKSVRIPRERAALRHAWLPAENSPVPVTAAVELYGQVRQSPERFARTLVGTRLREAIGYVRQKKSADRLEDHLRYLAELESDKQHGSFALVRVIAWTIPILGFLGTVIGITLAIANVTPEQLESSLHEVTGGLAVAFDTTAVALSLSMVLMFVSFLVERAAQSILLEVETFVGRELGCRFHADDPVIAPYLQAVRSLGETILSATEKLVRNQAGLWATSLAAMNDRHRETDEQASQRMLAILEAMKGERLEQTASLQASSERIAALQTHFAQVAELLARIAGDEQRLVSGQERLAQNLQLLRETQGLDEAVQSLTAAAHLLTIRNRPIEARTDEAA